MLGSMSPDLVPIMMPERGEKPMLVSRLPRSPVRAAARLQPAPRWQETTLAPGPTTSPAFVTTYW